MAKGSDLIANCIETAKAMDEVLATAEEKQAMLDGLFTLIMRECLDGRITSRKDVARFCKESVKISFAAGYGIKKPDGG
nr:MAG TPA: hypothetical protein [Caudoviricetes sp.]